MSQNLANEELAQDQFSALFGDENFDELYKESLTSISKEGEVVKGIIVSIEKDIVYVNVGLKSEGQIPLKEFMVNNEIPDLQIGDEVEVFLECSEDRSGKAVLSREKALREQSWKNLEALFEKKENVQGVIFSRVKAGYAVDIDGIIAFLPGSQVDIRQIKDIAPLIGVSQPFQIVKMHRVQGNINVVVSRRAVLEESRIEARNELLSHIHEGKILDGVVKNITGYGAFIDLGGYDGLLHVTDISWKRVDNPAELLTVGEEVRVQVIKFDNATKRISLGMKQLTSNPWENISKRLVPNETVLTGRVTNITEYGAFVEIEPGIEGLVYMTDISWTKANVHPRKLLTPGQEIKVMVLKIDPVLHRIGLGIKQCRENPWEMFADKYPVGSILQGEIKNIVDFGFFVGIEDDIDGLVHISDLTWSENQPEEMKKYNKGDSVTVKVLNVEVDKERVSLGIKQLSENPMEKASSGLRKNAIVTCTVTAVKEEGIEVSLGENITSFIKKGDLSRERVEQRPDRFAMGDRVDAKIVAFEKGGKLALSIKALEMDEEKKAIAEYGSTDSGASLGDILGAALDHAKSKSKKDE